MWFGSPMDGPTIANYILHRYTDFIRIGVICHQAARIHANVWKKMHEKYVHVLIDTMTSPKKWINTVSVNQKHLNIKKNIWKRKMWFGSHEDEVKCRKRNKWLTIVVRKLYEAACLTPTHKTWVEGGEEGQPQQFLVRATFSSFSHPSHTKILVLQI